MTGKAESELVDDIMEKYGKVTDSYSGLDHIDIDDLGSVIALIKAHYKEEAVDIVEEAYADKDAQPYKKKIIKALRGI